MFPKSFHSSYISTPVITSSVQHLTNFQVVFELGSVQHQGGSFIEILVDGIVAHSEYQGPNYVLTVLPPLTRNFGSYYEGAEIKVRVTADNITKISSGFVTTFALFSGFPVMSAIIVSALKNQGPGLSQYEWSWQPDTYTALPSATYSSVSVSVVLESRTTSPASGFVVRDTRSGDASDWLSGGGPFIGSGGQSSLPAEVRATLTINAAGYSISIVSPGNTPT